MAWNFFNGSYSESIDTEDFEMADEFDDDDDDGDEFGYEFECSESEDEEVLHDNVYKMQMHKFDLFKAQDQDTGLFDVTFVVEGKYLYANKYVLMTASETFNAWLSDRWTTKNDPIQIETYAFDIFYQLCCFLYSGGCTLTKENAFKIVDAAEFFGIQLLKDYCDTYIIQRRSKFVNDENVLEVMDFADQYSLPKLTQYVDCRVLKVLAELLEDEKFLTLKKCHLLRIFKSSKALNDYVTTDDLFETLVKWTEHQAKLKKDESNDDKFDIEEVMKTEFSEFLPYIEFEYISVDSLVEILAEKPFIVSPSDLACMFPECEEEEQEQLFKAVYQLAEAQALKKQKTNSGEDFDYFKTIKDDLASIIPVTNFSDMSIDFIADFLVDRGFLFPCKELLKILAESNKYNGKQEEKGFKAMYEVAEKEILQKQSKEPVKNFILVEAVKAELVEYLYLINFCSMDKKFLKEFVGEFFPLSFQILVDLHQCILYLRNCILVAKGILTHEQVISNKVIKVEINSGGNSLVGMFLDKLEILDTVGENKVQIYSYKKKKQRFIRFKFQRPSKPSELKMKDRIEWYLCLEWDGTLTAKHQSIITETDYLIAELKTSNGNGYFRIKTMNYSSIKVTGV